jgi:hypothetical protein
LVFDLNIGLVRAAPLTVALALGASVLALVRGMSRLRIVAAWTLVAGMALVCSGMANWNHGTSGPSRYALWIFPLLVGIVTETGAAVRSAVAVGLGWAAVVVQGVIFVGHGGFAAPSDYLEHSWAAQTALRRWPALYSPSYEIFRERTLHVDASSEPDAPVIYMVDGKCRKALAQKRHAEQLRASCGPEPLAFTDFRAHVAGDANRNTWTYVDY